MATPVILPKQGNTVETCILTAWKKAVGDAVRAGEGIADVETDKAMIEVASPVDGVMLEHLYPVGAEIPVMTAMALIGDAGEKAVASGLHSAKALPADSAAAPLSAITSSAANANRPIERIAASPRARRLAAEQQIGLNGIIGTGAERRIIERDVRAALDQRPVLTRAARDAAPELPIPTVGSGIGGRVTLADRAAPPEIMQVTRPAPLPEADAFEEIPLKGVRKVIAERMRTSLHTTAQLTLTASADAQSLQAYRARLKTSAESLGLREISINDLILYALSRTLRNFPALNATLQDGVIRQYRAVHLGFAVDTPRGLLVPVIRHADSLSLKALAAETKRLAAACQDGTISPDDLNGGTFTVSNLGALGVETFTPVINPPQVAILGVGKIDLKAIELDGRVQHVPHMHLSLTVDHQAVDGAPGARFLMAVGQAFAQFEVMLAL